MSGLLSIISVYSNVLQSRAQHSKAEQRTATPPAKRGGPATHTAQLRTLEDNTHTRSIALYTTVRWQLHAHVHILSQTGWTKTHTAQLLIRTHNTHSTARCSTARSREVQHTPQSTPEHKSIPGVQQHTAVHAQRPAACS